MPNQSFILDVRDKWSPIILYELGVVEVGVKD